jgi:hypothetical protein
MVETLEDLRYPIGRYQSPEIIDAAMRSEWIDTIAALPGDLSKVVEGLNDQQLDTPYRTGGWTVRQLVHHIADSHLNSQIRFRWGLTEHAPLIKAYDEKLWAELPDAKQLPIDISLHLLNGLHERWTGLLRQMSELDFKRCLIHPESGELSLEWMLGLYAWHGRHHVAHISRLRKTMNW